MSKPPPPIPPGATPVWAEGYAARLFGLERQDNPYLDAADLQEDQWDDGWLFADVEITRRGMLSSPDEEQGEGEG